jgi:hypothetical protein
VRVQKAAAAHRKLSRLRRRCDFLRAQRRLGKTNGKNRARLLAGRHERFAQTLGLRRNSASKKVFLLLLLPAPFK